MALCGGVVHVWVCVLWVWMCEGASRWKVPLGIWGWESIVLAKRVDFLRGEQEQGFQQGGGGELFPMPPPCATVALYQKNKNKEINRNKCGDLTCALPWYEHTSTIIPLPRIQQHHFCFIEFTTDAQILLANLDHDYPYSNSLLVHLGGVKQLGMKHLAQGRNRAALVGFEPTTFLS